MSNSAQILLLGQFTQDHAAVQEALELAVARSEKTYLQIARELTELLKVDVTPARLAHFIEIGSIPHEYIRAFCDVTGDSRLLHLLPERQGLHVIAQQDWKLLQWAKRQLEIQRLQEECRDLLAEMTETE